MNLIRFRQNKTNSQNLKRPFPSEGTEEAMRKFPSQKRGFVLKILRYMFVDSFKEITENEEDSRMLFIRSILDRIRDSVCVFY